MLLRIWCQRILVKICLTFTLKDKQNYIIFWKSPKNKDSTYDPVTYNIVKTRLLESLAEAKEQTNRNAGFWELWFKLLILLTPVLLSLWPLWMLTFDFHQVICVLILTATLVKAPRYLACTNRISQLDSYLSLHHEVMMQKVWWFQKWHNSCLRFCQEHLWLLLFS